MGSFFMSGIFPEKWWLYAVLFFFHRHFADPSSIDTLQTLVVALSAGLGVWDIVNLLEGCNSDSPGANQGMKQLMAGVGIIVLGISLISLISLLSDPF